MSNPRVINGMNYQHGINWPEIAKNWLHNEGTRPEWQTLAKEKGWSSWLEWRSNWVKNFNASKRQWHIYEIETPILSVPEFLIGPTQGWQAYFPKEEYDIHNFRELAALSSYKANNKVQDLIKNFPSQTEFIGIHLANGKIALIDGHHRAMAITLIAQQAASSQFKSKASIALCFFAANEDRLLVQMRAKGSSRPPR